MRATWVSKEPKMFKEFESVGFLLYFSAKSEKISKNSRNREKGMVWGQFFEVHSLLAEK